MRNQGLGRRILRLPNRAGIVFPGLSEGVEAGFNIVSCSQVCDQASGSGIATVKGLVQAQWRAAYRQYAGSMSGR